MEDQHPMVPVPQALRTVLQQTATELLQRQQSPIISEKVSLSSPSDVIGRISSETMYAPKEGYPPYHASIMDGYAINLNDCQLDTVSHNSHGKKWFQIANRVHAGRSNNGNNNEGDAVKADVVSSTKKAINLTNNDNNLPKAIYVTTGAVIPYPEYNAVIPIENVDENVPYKVVAIDLSTLRSVEPNEWIRNVGCDISPNTVILERGCTIQSVHIGLLLQCGITEVNVQPVPVVGILSTGNELMSIDEMKKRNCLNNKNLNHQGLIPDANGPMLMSLLSSYRSCRVINYGIANDDDIDALAAVVKRAIQECNVLITSGGASVGEKDVIEHVLHEIIGCQIHFGRLHMKPGKPTTFATVDTQNSKGKQTKCLIFGLPGNPVSAYVCTELLVRPCLDMLHGTLPPSGDNQDSKYNDIISTMVQNADVHAEIHASLTKRVKLDSERPEYLRVTLSTNVVHYNNGESTIKFEATPTGVQRSSRIMSLCDADGLMLMPQDVRGVKLFAETGETYPVLLLRKQGGCTISNSFLNSIKLRDSIHYQTSSLTMGILEIVGSDTAKENEDTLVEINFSNLSIKDRIESIISDSIKIIQDVQINVGESVEQAIRTIMSDSLDIILVVVTGTSFPVNVQISELLRGCITKEAYSLSYQARKSAASENPLSALFEPVAGYCKLGGKSCMLLSVPNEGMESAIDSVEALLRKGAFVASGKKLVS